MSMRITVSCIFSFALCALAAPASAKFTLEEATIDSIHAGIKSGEVSCKQIVEAYVARAQAYNGICTKLVTADGAKVPAATGTVRAGAPLKFPTDTVAIKKIVKDFDKYKGLTPDF